MQGGMQGQSPYFCALRLRPSSSSDSFRRTLSSHSRRTRLRLRRTRRLLTTCWQPAKSAAKLMLQLAEKAVARQRTPRPPGAAHLRHLRRRQCNRQFRFPIQIGRQFSPRLLVKQRRLISAAAVRRGAGPLVSPRQATHPGTDRITLGVSHRQARVIVIHRAGKEPILPEMPAASMHAVDISRV